MEKVKFGEFRLDSVMNISSSKAHINKNALQSSDLGGDIPYVTRSTSNNGVSDYIKRYLDDETYLNAARQITIAMDTYVMYYQSEAFYTGNRVKVGVPTFEGYSDNMAEYLITAFNKAVEAFSWGHNMNADQLEAIKITLPMIDDETPDWEYMDNYVKDIKARRLKIIEDFVDKELTEIIEMKVLEDVEFGEFELKSLFDKVERGTRLTTANRVVGDIPLVTAGEENFGISEHISNGETLFSGLNLTIDMFGNSFVRDYEYYADDNILSLSGNMSIDSMMYIKTQLGWLPKAYNYAQQFRMNSLAGLNIKLPMIDEDTPDWDFMDNYMKRIESEKKDLIRQFVENAGGV